MFSSHQLAYEYGNGQAAIVLFVGCNVSIIRSLPWQPLALYGATGTGPIGGEHCAPV